MKFELLNYRQRWRFAVRAEGAGKIILHSCDYGTETDVREAIQRLAETDWSKLEIVLSRY